MKKLIILALVVAGIYACGSKDVHKNNSTASSSESKPKVDGAAIFKQHCELCHGADGKLGLNGSKDLTVSQLDLNERIAQISKGKGLMIAYENILSLSEIKAVAEYTMTLAK
jgi:cytochrome c6